MNHKAMNGKNWLGSETQQRHNVCNISGHQMVYCGSREFRMLRNNCSTSWCSILSSALMQRLATHQVGRIHGFIDMATTYVRRVLDVDNITCCTGTLAAHSLGTLLQHNRTKEIRPPLEYQKLVHGRQGTHSVLPWQTSTLSRHF